jgi:hypothetical protein
LVRAVSWIAIRCSELCSVATSLSHPSALSPACFTRILRYTRSYSIGTLPFLGARSCKERKAGAVSPIVSILLRCMRKLAEQTRGMSGISAVSLRLSVVDFDCFYRAALTLFAGNAKICLQMTAPQNRAKIPSMRQPEAAQGSVQYGL